METIKSRTLALSLILLASTTLSAQEDYKVNVAGKQVKLSLHEINKVEIEGTTGNEIVFTTTDRRREENERAKGLKAISSLGLDDNSGIGLSVKENGGVIDVHQIARNSSSRFLIKVPKNVSISYEHSGVFGSRFKVRNFDSELEISTNHNSMSLENVTGPMTINTVHGKVEIVCSSLNQAAPTSIVSVHGLVDLTLPATTKAELSLSTGWGEIFTDMDIQFDKSGAEMKRHSGTKVNGKLNGGGVRLSIKSSHGNIYLRKK